MIFDLETRERPVLKWAGGKAGILPQLCDVFPRKCKRFIEPFLGGGAVFFSLRKGTQAVINDANAELWNLYKTISEKPLDLMLHLDAMTSHYSSDYYYKVRSEVYEDKVEQAARTIFLNKTGFNGLYRQNSKGIFNVPFGKRLICPALYDKENMLAVAARLKEVELLNNDFETVIDKAAAGDFVYCDPPYEPLSPTSSFNSYTGGGFSQAHQIRLRDACVRAANRGAFVAVSNSSAHFILDLYKEWDIRRILAKRAINSKGSQRGVIEEVVVLLYPA